MSTPSKEAVEAAEDICSMLGDTSTIREAVRVQSAIDAATAPLQARIRELENYQLRMEGYCKVGTATEAQMLTHQLELANNRIRELERNEGKLYDRIRELEDERDLAMRELAKCDPASALAIKLHDHPQQQEKE